MSLERIVRNVRNVLGKFTKESQEEQIGDALKYLHPFRSTREKLEVFNPAWISKKDSKPVREGVKSLLENYMGTAGLRPFIGFLPDAFVEDANYINAVVEDYDVPQERVQAIAQEKVNEKRGKLRGYPPETCGLIQAEEIERVYIHGRQIPSLPSDRIGVNIAGTLYAGTVTVETIGRGLAKSLMEERRQRTKEN